MSTKARVQFCPICGEELKAYRISRIQQPIRRVQVSCHRCEMHGIGTTRTEASINFLKGIAGRTSK